MQIPVAGLDGNFWLRNREIKSHNREFTGIWKLSSRPTEREAIDVRFSAADKYRRTALTVDEKAPLSARDAATAFGATARLASSLSEAAAVTARFPVKPLAAAKTSGPGLALSRNPFGSALRARRRPLFDFGSLDENGQRSRPDPLAP